jgi:hypothetical protein
MKKWSPHCYLARDDLIVLENVELTGYTTIPRHMELNINHVKMALCTLAAFHASNIIYERLELRGMSIGDAYKNMLFETSYSLDNPWCMTGINAIKVVALRKTKYGIGSPYEHAIEKEFMAKVSELFKTLDMPMPQIPSVLCHRDLWRNNLMYRCDNFNNPIDCLLIDFQIARYFPLALDVIICILLPSSIKLPSCDIDACIKFYYEQLSSELMRHDVAIENVMSYESYVSACEKFKLMPLLMQPMILSLSNLPTHYVLDLLKHNEVAYMKMCNEKRDDVMLEFMAKDEFYCETICASIERLIEHMFHIN